MAKDGLTHWCKVCYAAQSKRYVQTDRGKAANAAAGKKYLSSDKGKAVNRAASKKYYGSDRGGVAIAKYHSSSRGKAARKAYLNTVNGHLHRVYGSMNQRCNDPKHESYKNYGGRGIKNLFKSSDEFVDYIVNVLQVDPRGLQIDRIDNDGGYEPGNIRFVTREVNQSNRRCTKIGG